MSSLEVINPRVIKGFAIGHATDEEHGTGCTAILCERGAVAGVDVRGGGPATRETDLLRPENMIEAIHAVMLSGGSAFGLDAAAGAMEFLEQRGCGFDTGVARVPIVCGASLFDLGVGSASVRPDKAMGLKACGAALSPLPDEIMEGNVGAGTGCSVGKLCGPQHCFKSGIGMFGLQAGDLQVAAIIAVNALGNVLDENGQMLAGVQNDGKVDTSVQPALLAHQTFEALAAASPVTNTTIGCIITNARITKAQANKVASTAHDGYARAINPVHTSNDGDTLFVMASGEVPAAMDTVAVLAAEVVESAIRSAVRHAKPAFGLPGLAE